MKRNKFALLAIMGLLTGLQSAEAVKVFCPEKITKQPSNGEFLYSGWASSRDKKIKFPVELTDADDIPKSEWIFQRTYQAIDGLWLECQYAPTPNAAVLSLHLESSHTKCTVAGPSRGPRTGTYFECEADDHQTKTKK